MRRLQLQLPLLAIVLVDVLIANTDSSEQLFESNVAESGSIKSPDYPYWSRTERYRKYKFKGEPGELVRIVFENFNLHSQDSNVQCGLGDSRLVYGSVGGAEDGATLCGDILPLPILSSSSEFFIEFWHWDGSGGGSGDGAANIVDGLQGFNATYRFVTNFCIETGVRNADNGDCQFDYDSGAGQKNGTIYSPNFPGPYLRSMECVYYFTGIEPYIRIQFTNFSLFGSDDCTLDDYVEMKVSVDGDENFFYKKLCGTASEPQTFEANSSSLFVVFHASDQRFDEGQQMRRSFVGFKANYVFTNETISAAVAVTCAQTGWTFLLAHALTIVAAAATIF